MKSMWLKEQKFTLRLGGQTFANVPNLIQYNGEPLFTVRRRDEDGELAIDCDVFGSDGEKIASIRRNNGYPEDKVTYSVDRTPAQITLTNSQTGEILVAIKKHGEALPAELDVSVRTYLPDGRLLDAGPDSCTLPGLFMAGNHFEDGAVGIAINGPKVVHGKEFENDTVVLDGTLFRKCKFDGGCTIIFRATSPTGLDGCAFSPSCQWRFEGAALLTLDFLRAMYADPAFRPLVEATFNNIRGVPNPL